MSEFNLIKERHYFILGYVRLVTNYGPLNLELHCDIVPKTCENFMKLCQTNYYNGTVFHRLIKHFMVRINWIYRKCHNRWTNIHDAISKTFTLMNIKNRFKVEIQLAREKEENHIGRLHFQTTSSQICLILEGEYLVWRILDQIQTNPSCKYNLYSILLTHDI